jgi:hypothetical protein
MRTECVKKADANAPPPAVDEETAAAIRHAWEEGGELAGVVELRRHFPLITDNAHARRCVRMIVGWAPRPADSDGEAAATRPDSAARST